MSVHFHQNTHLHLTRQKTATYNRLRGLKSESGVIASQNTDALRHMVSEQKNSLPLQVQQCVDDLLEHVDRIETNIAEYDRILSLMTTDDHRSQRLMELKGGWLAIRSPVSVMHMILIMGVNWQPGWV